MKKKGLTLLLIALIGIGLFGCSKRPVDNQNTNAKMDSNTDTSNKDEIKLKEITLKIGATPVPHSDILEFIKPLLKEKGINLEIVQFTDYVQPNLALQSKDLDANFFQHVPYLEEFNSKNNTKLSAIIPVHFEPLALYPGKTKEFAELKVGDKIAVPNDTTNEARALLLLETAGLIKVKEGAGLNATVKDIVENPKKLKIVELEAAHVPRALADVNLAVINGNYAIEAGLNAEKDSLITEDKDSLAAETFANVIVTRSDDNRPEFDVLKEIIQSDKVKAFLDEKYKGSVIPVF